MDLVVDLLVQVLRWLIVRLCLPAATPHDVVEWRTFRGREVFIGLAEADPQCHARLHMSDVYVCLNKKVGLYFKKAICHRL